METLVNNEHAYNIIRGFAWHSIILLSAFAFDLVSYFRTSEAAATSIVRVLVLSAKLTALVYQIIWLCNTPVNKRNQDETTVSVLAVIVIVLFAVGDVVTMAVVKLPRFVIAFVACTAAFLQLLMTSIERRARQRQLEKLDVVPFVSSVSGTLGTAALVGAFLWSAAAVLNQAGSREFELVLIVLLGLATALVVFGTLYISLYLNHALTNGASMRVTRSTRSHSATLANLSAL
ncbi:MAG: hypothetical protein CMI16_12870 [Opitutaceae bacterium]|nr:hypothetical protein [Opitutaceae bacterium]